MFIKGGIVASPTPTIPIASDSTTSIFIEVSLKTLPIVAAANQPAVPPPSMTIFSMGSSVVFIIIP